MEPVLPNSVTALSKAMPDQIKNAPSPHGSYISPCDVSSLFFLAFDTLCPPPIARRGSLDLDNQDRIHLEPLGPHPYSTRLTPLQGLRAQKQEFPP